jgi:hypothetical protein
MAHSLPDDAPYRFQSSTWEGKPTNLPGKSAFNSAWSPITEQKLNSAIYSIQSRVC